jgi:MFS family permease
MNATNNDTEATPTVMESLRALPRPFWVLCVGTFINRFGTFVFPFLTLYLSSLGHGTGVVQAALFAHGLGHLVAAIAGGWLADRIGRRNTIALSMFSAAVAFVCLGEATTPATIVGFAMVSGFTIALYHPASSALLADIIPSGERVRAYTVLRIAINGGWAAGVATGGWLAGYSYKLLFYGDAFTCVIFGALALFALPHGLRREKVQAPWGEAISSILANRPFLAVFGANLCSALVFCQMSTTYALQTTDAGFSTKFFGFLLAVNGVMIALLELPISNRTQRLPVIPVLAVGYLLVGGGFALNIFGGAALVLIAAMVVFTVGEMLCLPVSGAYVADLSPAEMRGRYMGVNGLSWSFAMLIGPLVGISLYNSSPNTLWAGSAVLGLLGALIIVAFGRPRRAPVVGTAAESTAA